MAKLAALSLSVCMIDFECEIEKHLLSTGASRETPVDKRAHRLKANACGPELVGLFMRFRMSIEKHPLSTGASREAPVDKCARHLNA